MIVNTKLKIYQCDSILKLNYDQDDGLYSIPKTSQAICIPKIGLPQSSLVHF